MFGDRSVFKEYKSIIEQIDTGERRPPAHQRPKSLTDSGFESFASPSGQAVFEGFDYFAPILMREISDAWTIEETASTLVKDYRGDQPELGRTYDVYYNGVKLGKLQVTHGISPGEGLEPETLDWYREHRAAVVIIDLHYLRFVPYTCALSLILGIEFLVGPYSEREETRDRAYTRAARVLTGYLWEALRSEDHVPYFDHRVEGPYDYLHQLTDHWKKGGIDPYERWGGDRSYG